MGNRDEQDDYLLTLPGLSEVEKMEVIAGVAKGAGIAHTLVRLGRFNDDLELALREDPDFKRSLEMANRVRDEKVEKALHRKATAGNVAAMKFWLVNRRQEMWSETKTVRHTGAEGGAIEVEHTARALRELITGEDRDEALGWIEAEAIEAVGPPALGPGEGAAGEAAEPDEAG